MRVALVGDVVITRPVLQIEEEGFQSLRDRLKAADAVVGNLELALHNYSTYPSHQPGGPFLRGDPALAKELRDLGFRLLSMANNHMGDWGPEAALETIAHLQSVGIQAAGYGEGERAARRARFLEVAGGRIALIACATTFPAHSRAGATYGDHPPRPGISAIRTDRVHGVTREQLAALEDMRKALGLQRQWSPHKDRVRLFDTLFAQTESPRLEIIPNDNDVADVLATISSARRLSDVVIASLHSHESNDTGGLEPPAFVRRLAHDMIDAGADVVAMHGSHAFRGVESYQGRPILYGLGNFIFQLETVERCVFDEYEAFGLGSAAKVGDVIAAAYQTGPGGLLSFADMWRGFLCELVITDRGRHLEFRPFSLSGDRVTKRGYPSLVRGAAAAEALDALVKRSAAFGAGLKVSGEVASLQLSEVG
jgi:poly-gamma-glutamate synthesis protein (capsule biosynthesis protein)